MNQNEKHVNLQGAINYLRQKFIKNSISSKFKHTKNMYFILHKTHSKFSAYTL